MSTVYYPQCRVLLQVVFDGFGGADSEPETFAVIPRSCKVSKNNYKEADTFDVTFDGKELPISPELIRNAGVQIYMYNTDTLGAKPDPATPIMLVGLIDNATLKGEKGLEVHASGRDYTGLLIDRQWDPRRRVPIGQDLADTIQNLADEVTKGVGTGQRLLVTFIGDPGELPKTVGTIHNKKTKKRGFSPAQGGKTYWDVIYNLCIRHGYIVFVRGVEIVISRPQVLIANATAGVHHVAYGRNLSKLEVQRKLGKETVPQIIVRSYDSVKRAAIEAKYPESTDKQPQYAIGTKKNEQRSFVVPGVTDAAALRQIAQNAYHALARGEAKIRFETKHLEDLEGRSLFELEAGRPVSIGFEPFIRDAVFEKLSVAQRYDRLVQIGYNKTIAALISTNFDKITYFRRPFYTVEATFSFDRKDGITVECEAANYIVESRELKNAGESSATIRSKQRGGVKQVVNGL